MISLFVTIGRFLRTLYNGFKEREFRALFLFVALLIITGSLFYSGVEHWRFIDSLYFSVTTLTTIGSNMQPRTDAAKIFTIVYIFFGLGSVAAFIAALAKHTRNQHPDVDKIVERVTKVFKPKG